MSSAKTNRKSKDKSKTTASSEKGTARPDNRADAEHIVTDVLFATKNDLPEDTRTEVVTLLNARLADCIDLQTHCKQAHWNVKGPQFIALHELFDKVNEAIEEYVDLIAERIVQLGGVADGTARMIAARTTLPDYPSRLRTGEQHVAALSDSLAAFGRVARMAIEATDELDDKCTADLMTEVTRGTDLWLWFVEAHQQTSDAKPVK